MTKAQILAALKMLIGKSEFTAAINKLTEWVQGKFNDLKDEIDSKVSQVYRPAGNLAASGLVASLLVKANLGKVWHLTSDATTTSDWLEGAGDTVAAGTDVGIVEVETTTYAASTDTEVDDGKTYYTKSGDEYIVVDKTGEGYSEKNPSTEGWYEASTSKSYKFNSFAGASYLQATDFETIGDTEAVSIVTTAIAAAESEE